MKLEGLLCPWNFNADVLSQTSNVTAEVLTLQPLVWVTGQSDDRALRLGPGPLLWGRIRTASVVDSGVLLTMTEQRCETTIAPKVYGAWNLHQAI